MLLHYIRVDLFVRMAFSTAGFQITPRLRHAFAVLLAFYKRLCGQQARNYHQSLRVPLNFTRTQRDALEMTEQSILTQKNPLKTSIYSVGITDGPGCFISIFRSVYAFTLRAAGVWTVSELLMFESRDEVHCLNGGPLSLRGGQLLRGAIFMDVM